MRSPGNPESELDESRDAALIFLYRLLFVLYAEDRGLLPVNDARYDDYGLRKRVRDDIARRMADEDTFSAKGSQTTGTALLVFSGSSTRGTLPLACLPTTEDCLRRKRLRCWTRCACPMRKLLRSFTI